MVKLFYVGLNCYVVAHTTKNYKSIPTSTYPTYESFILMRLAYFRPMAPRGAHPPDAAFLTTPPSAVPCHNTLISYWSKHFSKRSIQSHKLQSNVKNVSSINKLSSLTSYEKNPSSSISRDKIPSSPPMPKANDLAPLSLHQNALSTDGYHTILRSNTRRKKITKTSPKNYYTHSHKTETTESKPTSVFTKLSTIMQNEASPPVPSVTPTKDTNMSETSQTTFTDAEDDAIMAAFENPVDPPTKMAKTTQGSGLQSSQPSPAVSPTPNQTKVHSPSSQGTGAPNANPTPPSANLFPQSKDIVTPENSGNATPQATPALPNGVNIGMFTSTKIAVDTQRDLTKAPSIEQQEASAHKIPIHQVEKKILTCRFKLHISGSSCNLPHLAKQVAKLFRQTDPALLILPFAKPYKDSEVLDTEENLPINEESLKKWVVESYIQKDKLHFSMRFSSLKTIQAMAKKIFPWMRANKSYVKIDEIDSAKIACLGMFEGLHPDYRNRDVFKAFCLAHIRKFNPIIKPVISVYPRSVFAGAGLKKIESRGVVIEVASDMADYVLQTLAHPFQGDYSEVTFIPFTKTDHEYSETLRQVMIAQNSMLHDTKRKILHGLKNIHETFTLKDGTNMSVKNWLLSAQHTDQSGQDPTSSSLISAVDITTKKSISIIFHQNHEAVLHSLLQDLKTELSKYFPSDIMTKIYDPSPKTDNSSQYRIITDSEKLWADMIKRKYIANPQSDVIDLVNPPNKNRKIMYHGPSTPPSQMQENSFDSNSSATSQSFEDRLTQLELSASKANEKNANLITKTIEDGLKSAEAKLTVKTNERFDALNQKVENLETQTVNTLKKFSDNFETISLKLQEMNTLSTNVERLCSHILPPKSTAKDAMSTSDGGKNQ